MDIVRNIGANASRHKERATSLSTKPDLSTAKIRVTQPLAGSDHHAASLLGGPELFQRVLRASTGVRRRRRACPEDKSKIIRALSVRAQCMYDIRLGRAIPASVFWPTPKVASVLIELRYRQDAPALAQRRQLAKVAKLAFGQRRKKLINAVGSRWSAEVVAPVLEQLGVPEGARAQRLTVDQFLALTAALVTAPQVGST